jgi:phosphoribosylanthranilate isomerase
VTWRHGTTLGFDGAQWNSIFTISFLYLNYWSMTKIKICGITRLEDALDACRAGADALGFNFSSTSPRQITPVLAEAIIAQLPPFVQSVGIFVEHSPQEINAICRLCNLQMAQLHSEKYRPEQARAITEAKVIKVFRPEEKFSVQEVMEFIQNSGISTFLFDAFRPDMAGGTGEIISTALASRIFRQLGTSCFPILAGGLNATNVREAILSTQPYGVDTASGVESKPGFKDPEKVNAFIRAVHSIRSQVPL